MRLHRYDRVNIDSIEVALGFVAVAREASAACLGAVRHTFMALEQCRMTTAPNGLSGPGWRQLSGSHRQLSRAEASQDVWIVPV